MERTEVINRLNDLIQLDVDAVEAYEQAMKHVKYDDIRKKFEQFRDDHKGHIGSLSSLVQMLDGRPAKASPDLKGYLLEAFTALRSLTGTKGALEAMMTNEKLTNRKYGQAVELDFPEHVMKLVRDNRTHEELHINYIREVLAIPRREL